MKSGKTMVDKEEHSENRIVGMEGSKNATAENPVLALEHVNKSFPGVKALSDVSLKIYEGEVHALCG